MIAAATVGEGVAAVRAMLRDGGIDSWAVEGRLLTADAAGVSGQDIFANPNRPLDAPARHRLSSLILRRLAREPVAYILGRKEFWSLSFRVGPGTIIPRPDTEALISAIVDRFPVGSQVPRVLDLGTGTGCILLSILHEIPGTHGIGVDISEAALELARANAADLGLVSQASFVRGDWVESINGPFDVIVANPPYIPSGEIETLMPDVQRYEPRTALDGGEDGLDAYRRILDGIRDRLAHENTLIAVETSPQLVKRVADLYQSAGYQAITVENDLAGRARCVIAAYGNARTCKKALGNGSFPV
jgi:release factor glutamine methyltransferase